MRSLYSYIIEALKQDVQKWLKQVLDTQQSLVKDNKLQPIEVDVKKLNKPKKPFEYDQYAGDPVFKKLVLNNVIGFTVTGQMLKVPGKYLKDGDKEYKPNCYPYWYSSEENNVYFVGICMYDQNIQYIENYLHVINIESSLIVTDSTVLNKAMLSDFGKTMKKANGNIIGFTAKPQHPKAKAALLKMGFNTSKENKEILVYKI